MSKDNTNINSSIESNDIKRASNSFALNRWFAIGLGAISFGVISKFIVKYYKNNKISK